MALPAVEGGDLGLARIEPAVDPVAVVEAGMMTGDEGGEDPPDRVRVVGRATRAPAVEWSQLGARPCR